ncbi:hypothetical protein IWQ62_000420, partial [Dispira parvispora]
MNSSGHKAPRPQVTAFGRQTGRPSQPNIGLSENYESGRRSPGRLSMTMHDVPGKTPLEQQRGSAAEAVPRDSSQVSSNAPSRTEVHTYTRHSTY